MSIFDITSDTNAILAFDIFKMLGLESLQQEKKDEYLRRFTKLILEYYLEEKVGDNLTRAQIETLMQKYPPTSELNVEAFLQEMSEMLPNASDLFTEALIEMKAKIVHTHYETKREIYTEMLIDEIDPSKKTLLKKMIAEVERVLKFIANNDWEMVEWHGSEDF